MITVTGKGVSGGVVIGRIAFYRRNEIKVRKREIDDFREEIRRFEEARRKADRQLQRLYEKSLHEVGKENAVIFEIHRMILDDQEYGDEVIRMIQEEKVNAEYAVSWISNHLADLFTAMEDVYMQGRAADIRDVSGRLLLNLSGGRREEMTPEEPVILAADDLMPSETVQLERSQVLGLVTRQGATTSHSVILAKTMNIPAVIGVGEALQPMYDGKMAILDGKEGILYIDPDEQTLERMRRKLREEQVWKELLSHLKGKENKTRSGRTIEVCANIGSLSDVEKAKENDAGGIGLFRSEFLYLERETYPSEEEQLAVYRQVAQQMEGKRVIIRTMDIGADKRAGYFDLEEEENPALGFRAIRFSLMRPQIFKTQLRAVYRASVYGKIAVMFPMIISLDEVRRIKELIEEVKQELWNEGLRFRDDVEIGVMIETPAAVMISRDLAREVDFFSVGTNDLTQYTLAVDRQNRKLEAFYDPYHPAVLSMIRQAAENAHAEGKWIGICGELASDFHLTESFLEMGIDELSVAPGMILPLRKHIRSIK